MTYGDHEHPHATCRERIAELEHEAAALGKDMEEAVEENERLNEELDGHAQANCVRNGRIRELEAEVERLRAIVDRLPKTEDGVHIVPGMTVYDRLGYRTGHESVVTGFQAGRGGELLCLYFEGGFDAICTGYYSTREAASEAEAEKAIKAAEAAGGET